MPSPRRSTLPSCGKVLCLEAARRDHDLAGGAARDDLVLLVRGRRVDVRGDRAYWVERAPRRERQAERARARKHDLEVLHRLAGLECRDGSYAYREDAGARREGNDVPRDV